MIYPLEYKLFSFVKMPVSAIWNRVEPNLKSTTIFESTSSNFLFLIFNLFIELIYHRKMIK